VVGEKRGRGRGSACPKGGGAGKKKVKRKGGIQKKDPSVPFSAGQANEAHFFEISKKGENISSADS